MTINTEGKKPGINAHDLDMVAFSSSKKTRAQNAVYAVDDLLSGAIEIIMACPHHKTR